MCRLKWNLSSIWIPRSSWDETNFITWLSTWNFVFVRLECFLFNTITWDLPEFTIILFILNHSIALLLYESNLFILRVLLNWYIWKIKVLYELLLFDFFTSEKLLCSGTTAVLLKAVCFWDFWLASTGYCLNGVNEGVEDFFFPSFITIVFFWNSILFSLIILFKTCLGPITEAKTQ